MPASEPPSNDQSPIFATITLGLYYPIWFMRRRAALNRLDSPRKLRSWPFLTFIAVFVLQLIIGVVSGSTPIEQTIGSGGLLLLVLARLAVGIVMLVQCFFVKDILEDHLAGPDDHVPNPLFMERIALSGLMTFFFQIFYLQYVINRDVVGPRVS